ncbi:hypothetical protein ACFQBQ_02885 [Granulicella cerasi]|uniref:Uncharacterized protein n=1 Tax=Granulicella cerasi TaxID=741063 RepID=A0ABW1Z4T0_9BACT|nr:hypothetical protein [Granulicella cerasi]
MSTTPPRKTGLSPKEQKLQALRDKLAGATQKQAVTTGNSGFQGKSALGAKKTSFQRKAT